MLRFSLRRLFIIFLGCAFFLALFGILFNGARLVRVLMDSGDRRIVIESSHIAPKGTFFEAYRGDQQIIGKRQISQRSIPASEFQTHEYDPEGKIVAYYCPSKDPSVLNALLLVDFKQEAYAIYWSGCRADKCQTLDWNSWDRELGIFEDYLGKLSESGWVTD